MTDVLSLVEVDPAATRVLVEGFDMHSVSSAGGIVIGALLMLGLLALHVMAPFDA